MQIMHHIALRFDEERRAAFQQAGVELKKAPLIASVDIAEDDPRWQKILPLLTKFKTIDTVSTKFSMAEIQEAKYLAMFASSQRGYPEPADNNGYLAATFDLTEYCKACGIGAKQIAPFRLKKVPKLGRSLLQLNWILDEYFVSSDVWEAVFKPLSIACRPVVLDKTGNVIDSVVQLEIPQVADLDDRGLKAKECPACGRKKYLLELRGFFPLPLAADAMIFKSRQFFGSGAQAYRTVLVSSFFYAKMMEARLRGLILYPCAKSETQFLHDCQNVLRK